MRSTAYRHVTWHRSSESNNLDRNGRPFQRVQSLPEEAATVYVLFTVLVTVPALMITGDGPASITWLTAPNKAYGQASSTD